MSFNDISALTDIKLSSKMLLPDCSTITSTHNALLNLPQLPLTARHVDIFPGLLGSLISIGVLCDHGTIAVYTAATVQIFGASGTLCLSGSRSPVTKLRMIDMTNSHSLSLSPGHRAATAVTEATGAEAQIVAFYHAVMGSSLSIATIATALDKQYVLLPGLTSQRLRKYNPHSVA